ncbi:hypothetical protein BO71DRAFT_407486 [Aspergillus ellipticus CBS 707.79]|uniref:Leucine-rich repeat domain-containing protein n=1 Tax=Aspergillus ellipticus CBS 707.79 TaxID=1448320 RepID=A0A319DGW2_9EURO|nr:hypothetical protein BO71DRAFT_407486 [Aspergillus ellipticus CBS 707.79]
MDRLPAELIRLIGEHIQDRRTLLALVRCSRRLHAVLEPFLYEFHLDMNSFYVHDIPFIIRLWHRPDLARRVRSLDICWADGPVEDDYFDPEDATDLSGMEEFIEEALEVIFTPEEEEFRSQWREYLQDFYDEAWLAVLLVPLTRLKSLELGYEDSELMSQVLNKAAKRERPFHESAPFPFLRDVNAVYRWGDGGIKSDLITPFFYFPAVRSISGSHIWEIPADSDSRTEEPASSSSSVQHQSCPIRNITLRKVWDCRGMLDWLAVCEGLKHIYIEISRHRDDSNNQTIFNGTRFYQALLPFKRTLESLDVEYDIYYKRRLEATLANIPEDNAPFGSFKDFSALQHMTVRHAHLMRLFPPDLLAASNESQLVKMLPGSLRSFGVRDILRIFYPDLLSELSYLVKDRVPFPQLEELSLYRGNIDPELAQPLQLECKARGVGFFWLRQANIQYIRYCDVRD